MSTVIKKGVRSKGHLLWLGLKCEWGRGGVFTMSRPWRAEQGVMGDRDKKADPKKGKPQWWVSRFAWSIRIAKGVER